ncbi:MAG: DUF2461 domain-containing protein [Gemmatimonadaceae bacterium]
MSAKTQTDVEKFTGFGPGALKFLRSLARNNRRDWFEVNKDRYEREVKHPLRILVEEVDARLGEFAPEMVGNPKRSVFRIYRDVRFSKDKSPYKTNAAAWFYHRDAGHAVGTQAAHGGAGFYFQIAPKECIVAGGIWMPPTAALKTIREAIADDPDALRGILKQPAFKRSFSALSEEALLKRTPRGFDADHPAADLLRYKSFTVHRDLTEREILSAKLPDIVAKHFATMLPFVRWFNRVLGLPPHSRR